ncbi:hypothetical protein AB0J74_20575 [Asanoa sp. NPDC049573]|uniref:hypothetical protein n=1 Tax=Asanoa sp. NPDC049573 TaxID=3155396 RepID=UPI00342CA1BA
MRTRNFMRLTAIAVAVVGSLALGAAPAAAVAWEDDDAVLSTSGGPPGSLPCVTDLAEPWEFAKACWEAYGDKIWVGNVDNATGSTAVVYWTNYYPKDTTVYRNGQCVAATPNGWWGVCNKDMHENSLVAFKVCDNTSNLQICGPVKKVRT